MYFSLFFAISVFLYGLRSHFLFNFHFGILMYMLGEGTTPGNFETSPPAMSQQGGIPGGNEPSISIRGDSLLRNLEQPRGEAGASSSQGREVLHGTPIPEKDTWDALAPPFYMSKVVHIPGEVEDPLTLYNLSKLNGLLLFISDNVFHGRMEPDYIRSLQLELDQTEEGSLSAKLEEIRRRELARFHIPD